MQKLRRKLVAMLMVLVVLLFAGVCVPTVFAEDIDGAGMVDAATDSTSTSGTETNPDAAPSDQGSPTGGDEASPEAAPSDEGTSTATDIDAGAPANAGVAAQPVETGPETPTAGTTNGGNGTDTEAAAPTPDDQVAPADQGTPAVQDAPSPAVGSYPGATSIQQEVYQEVYSEVAPEGPTETASSGAAAQEQPQALEQQPPQEQPPVQEQPLIPEQPQLVKAPDPRFKIRSGEAVQAVVYAPQPAVMKFTSVENLPDTVRVEVEVGGRVVAVVEGGQLVSSEPFTVEGNTIIEFRLYAAAGTALKNAKLRFEPV